MIKTPLYIPEPLPGAPLARWFAPLSKEALYKKDLPPNYFEFEVERVPIDKAAAIVLPNNFYRMDPPAAEYIKKYADSADARNIPIFCFSLGDFTDDIDFDPRVRVFRLSVYGSTITPQDIVMPTATEDHGGNIVIRRKQEKPLVSFCGMGAFPTWSGWVKYYIKTLLYGAKGLFDSAANAKKLGVYWRRQMMQACSRSPLVDTHFIVRKTFSGSRKTIELDPAQARREYLESIVDSDFVLAPKGDGNYSNRFLKTLSLGRIPVLVDTDVVLPLTNVIDYKKIVVLVPMNRVNDTPCYVREFYDALTEEEWTLRQRGAREVFEKYLREDSFLRFFFETQVKPAI